jgi:putative membrane protein
MRWFHLTVIAVFVIATLIFAVQNLETVTVSFLGFSARAPLAVLAIVAYLLGMATGGSLFSLLKRSFERSRRHDGPPADGTPH